MKTPSAFIMWHIWSFFSLIRYCHYRFSCKCWHCARNLQHISLKQGGRAVSKNEHEPDGIGGEKVQELTETPNPRFIVFFFTIQTPYCFFSVLFSCFLSGIARKGGGGRPLPKFFDPFFHHVYVIFWHQYHVMWYFLVIFNTKIIKSTKIIITIITHIIVVIIVTWFCNTRKNVVFDVQKKLYNLPELGGGGGGREFGQCPKDIDFSYVRSSLNQPTKMQTSTSCSSVLILVLPLSLTVFFPMHGRHGGVQLVQQKKSDWWSVKYAWKGKRSI